MDFGHVRLSLSSVGSPHDAPAFIRLKFGEVAKEMLLDSEEYDGWISEQTAALLSHNIRISESGR